MLVLLIFVAGVGAGVGGYALAGGDGSRAARPFDYTTATGFDFSTAQAER